MGMTEEFETSLQVLRGFDTDISFEVNEIKVPFENRHHSNAVALMSVSCLV